VICGHPDAEVRVSDSMDETASVCVSCATAFVAAVAVDWHKSLAVCLGKADPSQREAHKRRLEAENAKDKAQALLATERREKARKAREAASARAEEKAAARVDEANRIREDRARAAARFVANGPKSLPEVAQAIGVSTRTLTRLLPYAIDQGYVERRMGAAGGISPGPVSVPRRVWRNAKTQSRRGILDPCRAAVPRHRATATPAPG